MKYSILVKYDETDGIFIASVPDLQGCNAHGNTPDEAVREVLIVQDMWLKTAEEKGLNIPAPSYGLNDNVA